MIASSSVFTPSEYQLRIYDWLDNGTGHGFINAVAGSGKTTTLIELMKRLDTRLRVLFLAFNRHIRYELQDRLKREGVYNVEVHTFNSFGNRLCKQSFKPHVEMSKDFNILLKFIDPEKERERYNRVRAPLLRMVGLLKALNKHQTDDYEGIANEYGIELGDTKPEDKFPELLADVYRKSILNSNVISLDDQIFQVVFRDLTLPQYDLILIDEGQDSSPVQIEMAERLANRGRIVIVGDPDQSIYMFRGAHPDALAQIAKKLNATELPLNLCYRCPDNVLDLLKDLCPRLETPKPNPKGYGELVNVTTPEFEKQVQVGDFVLCRTTAPLVKRCLRQLSVHKKPAIVKGRDISDRLFELIEKIHGNPRELKSEYRTFADFGIKPPTPDIPEFRERLRRFFSEQKKRMESRGRDTELQSLEDRVQSLEFFSEDVDNIVEMIAKIDDLFKEEEDSKAVTFMTGHKAKGLEGDRVWWLRPDQCPSPRAKTPAQQKQERNLEIVIKTRHKKFFGIVEKEKDEK